MKSFFLSDRFCTITDEQHEIEMIKMKNGCGREGGGETDWDKTHTKKILVKDCNPSQWFSAPVCKEKEPGGGFGN